MILPWTGRHSRGLACSHCSRSLSWWWWAWGWPRRSIGPRIPCTKVTWSHSRTHSRPTDTSDHSPTHPQARGRAPNHDRFHVFRTIWDGFLGQSKNGLRRAAEWPVNECLYVVRWATTRLARQRSGALGKDRQRAETAHSGPRPLQHFIQQSNRLFACERKK